jgi:hypothetical protein
VLHRTFITFAAVVALGCVPMATNASAANNPAAHGGGGHGGGGHAMGGHPGGHPTGGHAGGYARDGHVARYGGRYYGGGGPIYNSCDGYNGPGYGCPGYVVPLVGGVINGILGGGY